MMLIHKEIHKLLLALSLTSRQNSISSKENSTVIKLVELLACRSDWETVISYSSKIIELGCDRSLKIKLYKAWIYANKELINFFSLVEMAKHFLILRRNVYKRLSKYKRLRKINNTNKIGELYSSLALLSYTLSDKIDMAKILYNQISKQKLTLQISIEAVGVYLSEQLNKKIRISGVELLNNLCNMPYSDYFSIRIWHKYAMDSEILKDINDSSKIILNKYKYAPEPYWLAVREYLETENWEKMSEVLKIIIAINPCDDDAIIYLARALEKNDKNIEALTVLTKNKELFAEDDYDFNISFALLQKKLLNNISDIENNDLCNISLNWLNKALTNAHKLKLPEAFIRLNIWELNTILQKEDSWLMSCSIQYLLKIFAKYSINSINIIQYALSVLENKIKNHHYTEIHKLEQIKNILTKQASSIIKNNMNEINYKAQTSLNFNSTNVNNNFVIQCPQNMTKGEELFFSIKELNLENNLKSIVGSITILSDVFYDPYIGFAAIGGNLKLLNENLNITIDLSHRQKNILSQYQLNTDINVYKLKNNLQNMIEEQKYLFKQPLSNAS